MRCQDNNLSLNMIQTKEMIVEKEMIQEKEDRARPILIDGAAVKQVENFKFHGVHITNKLSCREES